VQGFQIAHIPILIDDRLYGDGTVAGPAARNLWVHTCRELAQYQLFLAVPNPAIRRHANSAANVHGHAADLEYTFAWQRHKR
jgi:hypothetical protein